MFSDHLLILQVLLPLIVAPVCAIIGHAYLARLLALLTSYLCFIMSCLLLLHSMTTSEVLIYQLGGWQAPFGIEYHLDKLTAYLLLIVSTVAVIALTAGKASLEKEIVPGKFPLFYAAFLLNLTGLLGVVATGDAFNIFVFIEIASLSAYAMISVSRNRKGLYAAFQYLILGTLGASFILIAIGLLYSITGTLNLADLYERLPLVDNTSTMLTALAFFTIGISLKAAIFPLHLWLPNVYSYSPVIVTTFFAGTTTKVFIYVLIRFLYGVFGYELSFEQVGIHYLLLLLAAGGMLVCSLWAIRQANLKRLLAYSSVAQLAYIVLGIALITPLGLTASLAHMFNHTLIKVGLFLAVVNIIYYQQTDSVSELAGVAKQMPLTMACFVITGLSLIGVPLTAGFTSKWLLIQAAVSAGYWGFVILIVFSSILAVIYIWRVVEIAYFKPAPATVTSESIPKQCTLFYLMLILVTFLNIYFGIVPTLNVDFAEAITYSIYPPLSG